MTAALRSLLTNILDYAGLFPPAALPLDESIRNYARYLQSDDRWMLARFICPAGRLHELKPYLDELFTNAQEKLQISTLGRGGKDGMDTIANLEQDLKCVTDFRAIAGERAVVDVIETKLFADAAMNDEVLPHLAGRCADVQLRGFFEIPIASEFESFARSTAQELAKHNAGFKLRTGGTDATAFPPSRRIAETIIACRDAKCPLKFTAGLHHPIRAHNESVKTKMHGFLNVFTASVLAHAHQMDVHGVTEILESETAADFTFDEYTARWKTLSATRQRIEQVRANAAISFGSCSFDEPREDLRKLALL